MFLSRLAQIIKFEPLLFKEFYYLCKQYVLLINFLRMEIKSLLIVLALSCGAFVPHMLATPISVLQAQQNAQTFLMQRCKSDGVPLLRQVPMSASSSAYYVFNIGDNEGYVIVSGDDCAPAILGYSYSGSVDINNLPDNMRWWLDEYARQIRFMQENGLSASRAGMKSPESPPVAPLLTTRWDQVDPYNIFCPLDSNGNHYVTGCVATAMAQVMYYHHANSVDRTTHDMPAYTTSIGESVEAVPAGSFIDWDNMMSSYWSDEGRTEEQIAAVANLMKYCGASVQMNYKRGSSGAKTENVPKALIAYFNYDSKAECLDRDYCGLSDEEWEGLVYNELKNSRPVLYAGWRPNVVGHAFVCDGYDGDGFFHIVWGWGNTNGYYRLTAIDSVGTNLLNFNQYQQAVFYAEPRPTLPPTGIGIQFADPLAWAMSLHLADENDDGVVTMEEAAAVTELKPFDWYRMYSFDEFQYFTGITEIPSRQFLGCENLTSVKLPESVTTIGKNVFDYCTNMKELTIPSSVVSVGNQAFSGCTNLKHFIWNPKNCPPTVLSIVPNYTEKVTIGNGVEVIPTNFAKSTKIKELVIGKSVNIICANAFYQCSGLKRVVIPDSVTVIKQSVFYENTGLEELTLGKSLTEIGDRVFYLCSGLSSVAIPNSVTKIGMYAFYKCTKLRSVVIGNSVAQIKANAFNGCDSLQVVTCLIPEPISVNANVFNNVYEHATLRVPMASVDAYKAASPWNKFSRIIAIDPSQGDVNLDGRTDIADVADLIDQLLAGDFTEYGDVNADGKVNLDDVTAIIDKLLSL